MFDLNERSLEILRSIVDAYVETGEPVGSKALCERLGMDLSPATIRNVMARLEEVGLLYSPHTSAGRLPTDAGLRFFVHGILKIGELTAVQQELIEKDCTSESRDQLLEKVSATLSGLTQCAGLVIVPKQDTTLKHVEFLHLDAERALVVLVTTDGRVENRVIPIPAGLPPSSLVETSNYINRRLGRCTLQELILLLREELTTHQQDLNTSIQHMVEAGLATWNTGSATLIVSGQSNLLQNVTQMQELRQIKNIFSALETKEELLHLLEASQNGKGVQIFIGSQNELFDLTGCSIVTASYTGATGQIIGSLGVIGPSRIHYGRIIPMVEYTAKMVSRLLGESA